jgi:HSP20 family protein
MSLTRWTPISDLVSLHNAMDRLFSDSLPMVGRGKGDSVTTFGEGYLPLDVYQTDKEWVIRAAVPGADPQTVDVTCEGNTIRIQGEIKWPEAKSENYWVRENFYGKFSRQITIPEDAQCDQSKAEFQNGMLVLTVPKAAPTKTQTKKIPVMAGSSTGTSSGTSG